jgi:SAM-dependent methyltransferase
MRHGSEVVPHSITPTEIWDISAELLHTSAYREAYVNALASVVTDKKLKILDTACGTGFPTIDLYKRGFENITCADASSESLVMLKERFKNVGMPVLPTERATWQEHHPSFEGKFNAVVNIDNSLVYMDAWSEEQQMAEGREGVLQRLEAPVRNFYRYLQPNGKAVIGMAKTLDPELKARTVPLGEGVHDGHHVKVDWQLEYDWQKRHRNWTIETQIDGAPQPKVSYKSYIITRAEFTSVLEKVGFKNIRVLEDPGGGVYDDIFVAEKE